MNVAVIIAGGTGSRMNMDVPKQFINIYEKPVIIYTLEGFQRHPEIDVIEVVWPGRLAGNPGALRPAVWHLEAQMDRPRREHRPGIHP